jgi:hypothetical protein
MMKHLRLYFYRYFLTLTVLTAFTQLASAQTDADALMIPKNMFCAVGSYDYSSWTNYWEGTLKRDNANIGKVTTNAYMVMGNYGITNKLDVLFNVPYITTNASAGTLRGQSGFQDLSMTLKWLAIQSEIGRGIFSVHAILSGSIPLSNYEPNFLPVSIGVHSETASLRALANYQTGRFFVAAAAQYTLRSDITIDQNSYYTTQLISSNRVYMPNMNNLLVSAGYRSIKLNIEGIVSQTTTLGGFDIRRNDMPFPSNTMNWTTAGGLVKYSFDGVTGLQATVGGNRVLKGRNVGQSTDFFAAVNYVFDFNKKNKLNK